MIRIWTIENGDSVERSNATFIRTKIKNYETFWAKYIGCVRGAPADIQNISKEKNETRQLVGQWNYTILKNIISLDLLYTKYSTEVFTNEKILQFENDYTSSITQFYNILDIIKHIENRIGLAPNNFDRSHFNKLRESVIHNVRIKFEAKDGMLYVPKNLEWFSEQQLTDTDTWTWEKYDFSKIEYTPFTSFLNDQVERSLSLFNVVLKETLVYFHENFEKQNLLINTPLVISATTTPSGVATYSSDTGFGLGDTNNKNDPPGSGYK